MASEVVTKLTRERRRGKPGNLEICRAGGTRVASVKLHLNVHKKAAEAYKELPATFKEGNSDGM